MPHKSNIFQGPIGLPVNIFSSLGSPYVREGIPSSLVCWCSKTQEPQDPSSPFQNRHNVLYTQFRLICTFIGWEGRKITSKSGPRWHSWQLSELVQHKTSQYFCIRARLHLFLHHPPQALTICPCCIMKLRYPITRVRRLTINSDVMICWHLKFSTTHGATSHLLYWQFPF